MLEQQSNFVYSVPGVIPEDAQKRVKRYGLRSLRFLRAEL